MKFFTFFQNNKRIMPGSLIKHKNNNTLHIVKGDYSYLHGRFNGGCNFHDLCLYDLNERGEIINQSAWHNINDFVLVDLPKQKYFDKITEYDQK